MRKTGVYFIVLLLVVIGIIFINGALSSSIKQHDANQTNVRFQGYNQASIQTTDLKSAISNG